jgi:hypothetical protein
VETFGRPAMPEGTSAAAERLLASLRVTCGTLAASSALMGFVAWLVVGPLGLRKPVADLPGLPLSLTAAGTILLLLASRIRSGLLRRIPPPAPGDDPRPALAGYQRATLVSCALLEGTAILGLLLSLLTGEVRYGLIFAFAAVISILVRWPRRSEVERLLRGRGL